MSAKRYDYTQGSNGYELGPAYMEEADEGDFVHYSEYEKLADALREIRSLGPHELAGEIAEAALLSNGEEL